MVYKFFDKKSTGSGLSYTNKSTPQNEQLAEELHKPVNKKCVIDIFSKYAWVVIYR